MERTERRKRLRLPRLSRGWRIVRNVGATLVILSLAWAQLFFPVGDLERNFRRMERVNLLVPSEVVFQSDGRDRPWWGSGTAGPWWRGTLGTLWGVGTSAAIPWRKGDDTPLGGIRRYEGGSITSGQGFLAFGLPEEAGMIHGVLDLSGTVGRGPPLPAGSFRSRGRGCSFSGGRRTCRRQAGPSRSWGAAIGASPAPCGCTALGWTCWRWRRSRSARR